MNKTRTTNQPTNNMNHINSIPLPVREAEIAVNARLLYPYVGNPVLSYEDWASSLHQMLAPPCRIWRFRLLTGTDGELALNDEFATHFARRASDDLMGVIALILIDEGCHAAQNGDVGYINRMLYQFRVLAMANGLTHAETLHAFLQVERNYGEWAARLKEKYGMVYDHDYIRITNSDSAKPKRHPKDTGKGEVIFAPRFAMKVAEEEPTQRGKLVRTCFSNPRSIGAGMR